MRTGGQYRLTYLIDGVDLVADQVELLLRAGDAPNDETVSRSFLGTCRADDADECKGLILRPKSAFVLDVE